MESIKLDNDDFNELRVMPLCAEKLVINFQVELKSDDFQREKLLECLEQLKERLELEGLNSHDNIDLCREMNSSLSRNDKYSVFEKLKQLHSNLRQLNIPKLLRLTKENKDALEIVRDQNIYLFIGLTGSGKK